MATATTQLPPGIYRIIVAGIRGDEVKNDRLTDDGEGRVTLRPPSVHDESKQEVMHHIYDKFDYLSLISLL